jgi:hypothetical protein
MVNGSGRVFGQKVGRECLNIPETDNRLSKLFKARGAADSIEPGVERSATPGTDR